MVKKPKYKHRPESALVIAGLLIGIGYGISVNQTATWTLIGLGIGILAAFIVGMLRKLK